MPLGAMMQQGFDGLTTAEIVFGLSCTALPAVCRYAVRTGQIRLRRYVLWQQHLVNRLVADGLLRYRYRSLRDILVVISALSLVLFVGVNLRYGMTPLNVQTEDGVNLHFIFGFVCGVICSSVAGVLDGILGVVTSVREDRSDHERLEILRMLKSSRKPRRKPPAQSSDEQAA